MHFLIGTLIVLAIIYFMIVSPGFRTAAFVLLGIVGVGIYLIVQNNEKTAKEYQQQQAANERLAVTSIRPDDLVLSGVSLIPQSYGLNDWQLKGTIANNSKLNLGSIRFLVTVQECTPNQVCKIIGQETASTMSDNGYSPKPLVPAGQVRLFNTYAIKFANMPVVSNPRWEYKITEIRAAF
jgi:hypothetical protein